MSTTATTIPDTTGTAAAQQTTTTAAAYAPTPRTTLKRLAGRGSYDRAVVHAILDEALVCHVAFARDGQPFVIPMVYAREGDALYLHGSTANRVLRALIGGAEACVTVTLIDGLVMARSAFHHSVNYRSVVLYGAAEEVTDAAERALAMRALIEHVAHGRWDDIRQPGGEELLRTLVVRLPITEASAKLRSGPPLDDEEDYALPIWAGVIPLRLVAGVVQNDPRLPAQIPTPAYVIDYTRPSSSR